MLRNYFTTFVRILLRSKISPGINVTGLAIGVASSLLIAFYITDELSYDTFHEDANRIYRMSGEVRLAGKEDNYAMTGALLAKTIYEIDGIESSLRVTKMPVTTAEYNDNGINVNNLILADSNFFSFFSFKFIEGDEKTALTGPNKIVLTESAAQGLFGTQLIGYDSLIGKTIMLGTEKVATEITGIAANAPHNSHFHFDAVLSMETVYKKKEHGSFIGLECYTYIKLNKSKKVDEVAIYLPSFHDKHAGPEIASVGHTTLEELRRRGDNFSYSMMALTNIHLDSHLLMEMETNGNRRYLYFLTIIASFVLLLACVNYVNLSTAQAVSRAKEVGIRKTLGASQKGLIGQLMFESFIYTLIALFFGLALIFLFIEPFNFLTSKHLSISQAFTLEFAAGSFLFVATISALAGSYSSFYISSFRPSKVLEGKLGIGSRGRGLRNTIVTFQFAASAAFIMGSVIVYQQLQYLQTKSPGYNIENVVCLTNTLSLKNNAKAFKNEIKSNNDFVDAAFCNRIPSEIVVASGYKQKGSDQWNTIHGYSVDEDYGNTLKLELASGRFFSENFPSDSSSVVINEAAAKIFGIDNLDQKEYIESPGDHTYEIVGITKDFNFESLKSGIKPLVIHKGGSSRMTVRLTSGNTHRKIALLEKIWKKYTSTPFEYTFLDERLDSQYRSEEQLGKTAIVLTCLAIVIACLGLLGLVTNTAHQRTKEIGVRKVLGASVEQIVVLISRDFFRLIFVAFMIAVPVTWYSMNIWLKGFAYRISFNGLAVAVAGGITVIIALLTVIYHAIKAAVVNPVDCLRNE